jgi:hypothetical protein
VDFSRASKGRGKDKGTDIFTQKSRSKAMKRVAEKPKLIETGEVNCYSHAKFTNYAK